MRSLGAFFLLMALTSSRVPRDLRRNGAHVTSLKYESEYRNGVLQYTI